LTKRLPNRLLSLAAQNLRSSPAVAEQLLRAYHSISPHLALLSSWHALCTETFSKLVASFITVVFPQLI
jgi:hypothetical protein